MLNRITTRTRQYTSGGATTLDDVADERADILAEVGMTEAELRARRWDRSTDEVRALRRLDALVWDERGV